MPSPVGHTLAALALDHGFIRELTKAEALLLSALPDIDLLPTILGREREIEHGHATHSLTAAVIVGFVAAAFRTDAASRTRAFAEATAVYGSHLLLDAFGKEQADGLPLLWPMSGRRWTFRTTVFKTIRRLKDRPFLSGLINGQNLHAVTREIALLMPLVMIAAAVARGSR